MSDQGTAVRFVSFALVTAGSALGVAMTSMLACGGGVGSAPASPPCDQACQDDVAVTAFRDTMKLAFNLTLQGNPVGAQDASKLCPLGGKVTVSGTATSNASQGTTDVNLTYVFDGCAYSQSDTNPTQTYSITVTGTATEQGTLSQQPTATTALTLASNSMTLTGTVYAPPINYEAKDCAITLGQSGNRLGGSLCGRSVGASL